MDLLLFCFTFLDLKLYFYHFELGTIETGGNNIDRLAVKPPLIPHYFGFLIKTSNTLSRNAQEICFEDSPLRLRFLFAL